MKIAGIRFKTVSVPFVERVVVADLDMAAATRRLAELSRESPLFRSWWDDGLKMVGERL